MSFVADDLGCAVRRCLPAVQRSGGAAYVARVYSEPIAESMLVFFASKLRPLIIQCIFKSRMYSSGEGFFFFSFRKPHTERARRLTNIHPRAHARHLILCFSFPEGA